MAGASIGTRLGTRIETGSRHNLQCRVDKDRMIHGLEKKNKGQNADEELRRNKVKYMMHKDELVLCTSHNLLCTGRFQNRLVPYPKVVTTWEALDEAMINQFVEYCQYLNADDFWGRLRLDNEEDGDIRNLEIPNFQCLGYSMGIGYAHEYNGDTIATVQIGGLITVLNGAWDMHTGDAVQWYVQGKEESFFDNNGGRLRQPARSDSHPDQRQQHYMRNTGYTTPAYPKSGKNKIFMPKACDHATASFMDKQRVFAKCVSSAGPYEKVDILICTQSI